MKGLLELCKEYFGSTNLYDVLNIDKAATDNEVRKAYHKLSLQVHPDRVAEGNKLDATEKFKVLGKIHSILSDKEKRAIYDDTGRWNDDDDEEFIEHDWDAYWRVLFKPITLDDIKNYEKNYKNSAEELSDLKRAYVNSQGDMDHIFESVPFTKLEEEPRLREAIQKMIDSEEVPAFEAFINEAKAKKNKRRRKYEKEAKEADEVFQRRKKSYGSLSNEEEEKEDELESGLAMAIFKRQKERENQCESFFDSLEAKYASPATKKKKTAGAKKSKK